MTTHRQPRGNALALALLALAGLLSASAVYAQMRNPNGLPNPRLYAVFPAGGKAGSSLEIPVAGVNVEEPERLLFSTPGIKAEYLSAPPPKIAPKAKQPRRGMTPQPAGTV